MTGASSTLSSGWRTGAQWEALPRQEYGPKSTVHVRLKEWMEYGCLKRAWAVLLEEYDSEIGIEWEEQAGMDA